MREIINAALPRQRHLVLLGLALGLGLALAAIAARSVGGAVAGLTLLPILFFLGMAVREIVRQPGREGLRVDETTGSFFAPPQPGVPFGPALCGYFVYYTLYTVAGSAVDAWDRFLMLAYLLVAGGLAIGAWRRVPFVTLTAEGVSSGAPRSMIVVPWEAIGAGAPTGPGAAGRFLRLPIARPELVRRRLGWLRLGAFVPVRELTVAPEFLAAAIRHYVAHPEHRATIGTVQEYDRLRRALAGAPLTGQV
ncbi:hypothetical protein Q2K19_07765 [Micromonospora soli]|uniref:hypothetical protein n=1 Tax=Micromonospora sp. NBRC 110009 TaxID=3061627 RepID=UPI00267177E3|nr:hypothetical protein [Micromonospora sp. NBRC 110009]WKU00364.1 hypothetical protein Q2K19_07765 [Micromonospora sp. NBRC 110009]